MLVYRGYIGEVSSGDAGVLYARVINSGIYPIANAEAADAASLEREFQCSIDSYLEGCKELQIDPIAPVPSAVSPSRSA